MEVRMLDMNIISYLMKGHPVGEHYRHHLEGKTLALAL